MTKSTIIRNAGIVAAAGAMLAGSVAPANAFVVAEPVVAPVQSAPVLASYTSTVEAPAVVETAPVVENTAAVAPQSNNVVEISSDVDLSTARETVLAAAYDGLGGAYVWGGKTYKAWDCSGFVSYVYAQAGIKLTAYTYTMATELTPTSNPQPGDIVFTNNYAHVGIYVGDGKMISALNPSQGTMLTAVDGGGFMPVDGYYTAGI